MGCVDELTAIFAGREPLNLDELAAAANDLLPRFLPDNKARRGEVNPRLVRHMASLGLVDEPLRMGREARYVRRHLLQILTARRLMAEGLSTVAVKKLVEGAADARLESLLRGEASWSDDRQVDRQAGAPEMAISMEMPSPLEPAKSDALSFLQNIARRSNPAPVSPPPAPISGGATPLPNWVRVEIAPGLEIHFRDDFRAPPTSYEREKLLDAFGHALQKATKNRSRRR